MDKNSYLAIVISIVIILVWSVFFKPKPEENKQIVVEKVEKEEVKSLTPKETIVAKKDKENIFILENDFLKLEISSYGAGIKQVYFKKYQDEKKQVLKFATDKIDSVFYLENVKNLNFKVLKEEKGSITLGNSNIQISYILKEPYSLNYKINTENYKYTYVLSSFIAEEGVSRYGLDEDPEKREKEFLVYEAGDVEKNSLQKLRKDIFKYDKANWVGLSDRYFIFTVLTDADNVVQNFDNLFNLKFRTIHNDFNIYIGPKDVDMLNTLDPSLRNAVNFGVLSILSIPMLELMKFLYGIIPNYGVAILLLTLIVRLLMYPLQHKSMKSMKRMQELQPYIKKLQEKYKDDKEKLNKEMMQFMKTHKMNPMGGCLPMLLQLPVFIALYKVLNNAVELYRSPFVFWIKDLSLKDPYYVLPVLMGGMMFLQQKLMPNPTMDSAQSKMMMFMPIMFTFLMISLPSGLTLYIMFSTLLGVIQQYFTNKKPSKEISVNGN